LVNAAPGGQDLEDFAARFNFLTGGQGPCRQAQDKQALPKSHFTSLPLHGEAFVQGEALSRSW
jgi:hypothetical protein